jgi:hypothetical protein
LAKNLVSYPKFRFLCYEIINQLYLGVIFMTAAVLSAAGFSVAKNKRSQNGEKYPQNGVLLDLQDW